MTVGVFCIKTIIWTIIDNVQGARWCPNMETWQAIMRETLPSKRRNIPRAARWMTPQYCACQVRYSRAVVVPSSVIDQRQDHRGVQTQDEPHLPPLSTLIPGCVQVYTRLDHPTLDTRTQ